MESSQLPLRDIHLPEAISWWPPALGWWLLLIFIPLLLGFIYWLYKRATKKTAVKAAKKLLIQIKENKAVDNAQKLKELSGLLRRTAVSVTTRNECAGLIGQQWLEYLDRRPLKGMSFAEGAGQLLTNAHYQQYSPTDLEISQLIKLCEIWLEAQAKNKQ